MKTGLGAGLGQASMTVMIETNGQGFVKLGARLNAALAAMAAAHGLLNLFVAHTSASLCIQENADPDVLRDLARALDRIAPENTGYLHDSEGPDDMPAHIKTMLTAVNLAVPVRAGKLALGTWQEVYLIEHRRISHRRRLELDFIGRLETRPADA